jgi:tetratricopeptide (TPR) repeat protein
MNMRKWALILAILIAAVMVTNGQQQKTTTLSPEDFERYAALRRSGREALYNLDYEKAHQDFQEIARLFPNHPAGPQLLAARLWTKTLYESRRLQTGLYNTQSFYGSGDDKVNPKVVEEFRSLTREAKRRCDVRLKQDPKDIEALDFLAATAGLKASFEEAVERRHFAALRDGSEAVDKHRDVLKLDPTWVDAKITIGLYEYVVGSLPLPIKVVAGVTGFRGSKKRGVTLLEEVAKQGRWSQDDAKTVLILLYTREERFNEALSLARELSAKYPRNYLLRLEVADALVAVAGSERKMKNTAAALKAEKEAFETFDDILRDRNVRDTAARSMDLIHFKYGEVLLAAGQPDRAGKEFLAATKVEPADAGLVTMAHLNAARALDLSGKRDDALAQYKQVLARPNIYDAHDEAKKGLRQPFRVTAPVTQARSDEN